MITEIRTLEDVREFVHLLVGEGLNYHPNEDFNNYVNIQNGDPSYSPPEALLRNQLNDRCFEVCQATGADIYDISMEIFLKETGLDEFIPLPSKELPE